MDEPHAPSRPAWQALVEELLLQTAILQELRGDSRARLLSSQESASILSRLDGCGAEWRGRWPEVRQALDQVLESLRAVEERLAALERSGVRAAPERPGGTAERHRTWGRSAAGVRPFAARG